MVEIMPLKIGSSRRAATGRDGRGKGRRASQYDIKKDWYLKTGTAQSRTNRANKQAGLPMEISNAEWQNAQRPPGEFRGAPLHNGSDRGGAPGGRRAAAESDRVGPGWVGGRASGRKGGSAPPDEAHLYLRVPSMPAFWI